MNEQPFKVGDRVLVTGGYDMNPLWLKGSSGYPGTLIEVRDNWAAVELDEEIVLEGRWQDFGKGSNHPIAELAVARGSWLALTHGWVGQQWSEPIHRLHVGLCCDPPDLRAIPTGGGIGTWVESHATMRHLGEVRKDT